MEEFLADANSFSSVVDMVLRFLPLLKGDT
jgi:hypothetical protein